MTLFAKISGRSGIKASTASALPTKLLGTGGITIDKNGNVTTIGFDINTTELGAKLNQAIDYAEIKAAYINASFDAVVNLLTDRDAYNDEPAGFSVLVVEDEAVYYKLTYTSGDWSYPVPVFALNENSIKFYGAVGDGVTDDTSAIQDAFNSGVGEIYIPKGTFLCSYLEIPTSVKRIYGPGVIQQTGTVSVGNRWILILNSPALSIEGIQFIPNSPDDIIGLYIAGGSNIHIKNCNFYGPAQFHVYVSGCADVIIDKNVFNGFLQSAIVSNENAARLIIKNNKINRTITDIGEGIKVTGGYGHAIDSNYIEGGNDAAFSILLVDTSKSKVSNNIVYNPPVEAFGLDAINADCTDNVITGNLFVWESGVSHDLGMHFDGHNNTARCYRNIVSNNTITNPGNSGIGLFRYCIYNTISGNFIYNPGGGPNEPLHKNGIELTDDCFNNVIDNNIMVDQGGNMVYGIKEFADSNCDSNIMFNNVALGYVTAEYLRSGANSKVFAPTQVSP